MCVCVCVCEREREREREGERERESERERSKYHKIKCSSEHCSSRGPEFKSHQPHGNS